MAVLAIAWGVVVTALSLLCWGGQVVALVAPERATRLGLIEGEAEVEAAFSADARGEALWDVATLWSMVVAGVLLAVGAEAWAYFGLIGGGAYLYFAGRGVVVRRTMAGRGLKIGSAESVRIGLTALAVWGVMAAMTIAAAVIDLAGR
ncbi:MAG: hypothetical protein QNM02_20610 [Acidimicrobiia bacterium]|nr:hypothetical protein [Acidimicrobiia bacterium]